MNNRTVGYIALAAVGGVAAASQSCTPEELSILAIAQEFGGGDINAPLAQEALSVATCESGLNPAAYNGTCCHGLFQIHYVHDWRFPTVGCSWEQRYDPFCNAKVAKQIYSEQGWGPWSCQP